MAKRQESSSISRGVSVIQAEIAKIPAAPGVYRMIAEDGEVLYVGKAKALKKRVKSYTAIDKLPVRLQRMVALTWSMEFVHTATEVEALLLESNLIKKFQPRFNILLKDDKSFPYIRITGGHDYPQVTKHRGLRKPKGEYFGPFASAGHVNFTINTLQRVFMLRNCTDHIFDNRSRPCLQYHIKRCTAPCVGLVTKDQYDAQLSEARDYLSGKSRDLQQRYADKMQAASDAMNYEEAGAFRDRIRALSYTQSHQDINVTGMAYSDVITLFQKAGRSCIQIFFFRGGQNYGNRSYFPHHQPDEEPAAIIGAFMAQFYQNKPVPKQIIVNHAPEGRAVLIDALSMNVDFTPQIIVPQRGAKKRVIEFALNNAREALARREIERKGQAILMDGVAEFFDMDDPPERIEIYDNSHISGTNMVGAMVVAGAEGFIKAAYRKFNIREADAGDDYAMMREVIARRFKKYIQSQKKEAEAMDGDESANTSHETDSHDFPDLLLIDGGLGQYNAVREVLDEYGLSDRVMLVAISKGEDRDAGREKFFFVDGEGEMVKERQYPINDPTLHYLQRLRDESHRFAIGAHRTRRTMDIKRSPLDGIPGVGAARKRALLHHFGSGKAVKEAALEDLMKVDGLSKALAQKIYDWFR